MIPKCTSSVHDINASKPPSAQGRCLPLREGRLCIPHLTPYLRFLTENADVWSQNAWDHVPPPTDQNVNITASLARQRAAPVPDGEKHRYNSKPAKYWCVPNCLILNRILYSNFLGPLGTIFTRQTPLISSRTASGRSFIIPGVVGIVIHDQTRLHLEFPELVAAAEPSVRLSFSRHGNPIIFHATHRLGVVQSSK